jgi:hypothetical protein
MESFSKPVVRKRDDEKSFRNHMVMERDTEERFTDHMVRRRGDGESCGAGQKDGGGEKQNRWWFRSKLDKKEDLRRKGETRLAETMSVCTDDVQQKFNGECS